MSGGEELHEGGGLDAHPKSRLSARRRTRDYEKVPEASPPRPAAAGELKLTEAQLGWPDRPAVIGRQGLDRLARLVERTNVAELGRVPIVLLLDPSKGKALRSANVGPVLIDSAGVVLSEERAGPFGTRGPVIEKISVATANVVGLRVEHSQPVDAARAATESALQTWCVEDVKPVRLAIHVEVQRDDRVRARIGRGDGRVSVGQATDVSASPPPPVLRDLRPAIEGSGCASLRRLLRVVSF